MPLIIPNLDDRKFQDLLDETLARVPIHNPEWTNFNESDPGVTIVELFSFLTENLLYRSNQIPERNRRKFLSLLGLPLRPASSSKGIIVFTNERGPLQTLTLNDGLEVRAGQVPYRTVMGLDVLPVEGKVYYKRVMTNPPDQLKAYYKQLYTSLRGQPPTKEVTLYETVPFVPGSEIDLGQDTVDGSLWIALLLRATDKPYDDDMLEAAREAIGGKTMNLGIFPSLTDVTKQLKPGGTPAVTATSLLQYQLPRIGASGGLQTDPAQRVPQYRTIDSRSTADVLSEPGIVELTLPAASELTLWNNIDPLESGAGDFPPGLEDSTLDDRLITWVRVRSNAATGAKILWAGINAVFVNQRNRVSNESLPLGTGEPDQTGTLSKTPVIPESVGLTVTVNGVSEKWEEIDDLLSAGPEVPVEDRRQPPMTKAALDKPTKVFVVDAESGVIQFGDGIRGARPPFGAVLRADYDYGVGRDGNVGAGSINTGPSLPTGLKITNPVPTWGGSEAETVEDGEKQIARYLQHRDRLVTQEDFVTIVKRTPGVDIGRVEVLPAYNPRLAQNEPGDAPGAVTVMVIPRYDTVQPDAPLPDRLFLDAVCEYLEPRRLVTTEVFVRGPAYKKIWISVGINVVAGVSVAQVRESVKQAILEYISPLPQENDVSANVTQSVSTRLSGWPLRKSVVSIELLAEANRVDGVLSVNSVLLAEGTGAAVPEIKMSGLELPMVAGISVTPGDPTDLDQIRGQGTAVSTSSTDGTTAGAEFVSIPVVPEGCV
jgi:Baseplate J-like protein